MPMLWWRTKKKLLLQIFASPWCNGKVLPKTTLRISQASVPTFVLSLRNLRLILKCDMNEKITSKSPHSILNSLQSTRILFFHNLPLFWLPRPLSKYTELKNTCDCLSQRGLWYNCSGSCSFRSHHGTKEKNIKVVVEATATFLKIISCSLCVHHL